MFVVILNDVNGLATAGFSVKRIEKQGLLLCRETDDVWLLGECGAAVNGPTIDIHLNEQTGFFRIQLPL
ncbi:MAG: hypothetical protein ACU83V_09140 [Gammaproteobacteria bacterium]